MAPEKYVDYRLCNGSGGGDRLNRSSDGKGDTVTIDLGLGAVARDVASLATAVAGLASGVERASVGGSAITRNVA